MQLAPGGGGTLLLSPPLRQLRVSARARAIHYRPAAPTVSSCPCSLLPALHCPQLYELAASGVRERAKLRQEVNEVQTELQGTRRQLHSFMASLMQLKNSMASAGEGDLEHALELLQSSSYSASLNSESLGSCCCCRLLPAGS